MLSYMIVINRFSFSCIILLYLSFERLLAQGTITPSLVSTFLINSSVESTNPSSIIPTAIPSIRINSTVCGSYNEGATFTINCPSSSVIISIDFASYGTPNGICGSYSESTCHWSGTANVISSYCLYRSSCSFIANIDYFGGIFNFDPCLFVNKYTVVQVTCSETSAPSEEPTISKFPTYVPSDLSITTPPSFIPTTFPTFALSDFPTNSPTTTTTTTTLERLSSQVTENPSLVPSDLPTINPSTTLVKSYSPVIGINTSHVTVLDCTNNSYITGFFGRYGNIIDAIGITCSDGQSYGLIGGEGGQPVTNNNCINGVNQVYLRYGTYEGPPCDAPAIGLVTQYCTGINQGSIGGDSFVGAGFVGDYTFVNNQIHGIVVSVTSSLRCVASIQFMYYASARPTALLTFAPSNPSGKPSMKPSRPTFLPTIQTTKDPSDFPTNFPSITATGILKLCTAYSITNTNNAQQNTVSCTFTACSGNSIVIATDCLVNNGGASGCNGDLYIRLYDVNNVMVASNDDSCGLCSVISYTIPFSPSGYQCTIYDLNQGCYGSGSCSGTFSVKLLTVPTLIPTTTKPSLPTLKLTNMPSSKPATAAPSLPTMIPSIAQNSTVCASSSEGGTISLICPSNSLISFINFASYGLPNGVCGSYSGGSCHWSGTANAIISYCLYRSSCSFIATTQYYGGIFNFDPCVGVSKTTKVQVTCSQTSAPSREPTTSSIPTYSPTGPSIAPSSILTVLPTFAPLSKTPTLKPSFRQTSTPSNSLIHSQIINPTLSPFNLPLGPSPTIIPSQNFFNPPWNNPFYLSPKTDKATLHPVSDVNHYQSVKPTNRKTKYPRKVKNTKRSYARKKDFLRNKRNSKVVDINIY